MLDLDRPAVGCCSALKQLFTCGADAADRPVHHRAASERVLLRISNVDAELDVPDLEEHEGSLRVFLHVYLFRTERRGPPRGYGTCVVREEHDRRNARTSEC